MTPEQIMASAFQDEFGKIASKKGLLDTVKQKIKNIPPPKNWDAPGNRLRAVHDKLDAWLAKKRWGTK